MCRCSGFLCKSVGLYHWASLDKTTTTLLKFNWLSFVENAVLQIFQETVHLNRKNWEQFIGILFWIN